LIGRGDFFVCLRLKKKLWFEISQPEFHDRAVILENKRKYLYLARKEVMSS